MPSRSTKRRKIKQASPHVPGGNARPGTKQPERLTTGFADILGNPDAVAPGGIAFQVVIFLLAFAIILSRRPDAMLNAQFYAEDGMVWYPDAYQFGLHSFLLPVAGYLHLLIRSVALLALLFPFSVAPLMMNLSAAVVQILPVNIFLSSRFSHIPLAIRLLGSFVYLALPNTWEIDANLTNVQWHLVLLASLLLLAQPVRGYGWRILDGTVMVLTSFSSPIAILLVPMAAALWWKRRRPWSALSLALLVPGALVEALVALLSHTRQLAPNGATFARLVNILGGQLFLSTLLGFRTLALFTRGNGVFFLEVVAAVAGLALVSYTLFYAPLELKIFILFSFAALGLGLARPLAGPPNHPQWEYLCIPGRGSRYFFLPMLAFLASLSWIASRRASPRELCRCAVALLLLLPIGIVQDWRYPPFRDLHFSQYAASFDLATPGTRIRIPINPGMTMEITKR